MIKSLSIVSGCLLILVGLVVLPMPIPFGAIMIVSGLVLLVSASPTIAMRVRSFRHLHRGADKVIRTVEDRLPEAWRKALKRSDP